MSASAAIRKAASALIARQRADGGWGQIPTLASDAYATGQALTALAESGAMKPTDPAYKKGVRFLLGTQLEDGSWHVRSRAVPVQPYFDSEFPHGTGSIHLRRGDQLGHDGAGVGRPLTSHTMRIFAGVCATLVVVTLLVSTTSAQWIYRDPSAPRTPDGRVDVKAPPPRTASGLLDLSGIWQTDIKYNANLAADLKPGDIVMLPWGQALFDERRTTTARRILRVSVWRRVCRA